MVEFVVGAAWSTAAWSVVTSVSDKPAAMTAVAVDSKLLLIATGAVVDVDVVVGVVVVGIVDDVVFRVVVASLLGVQ